MARRQRRGGREAGDAEGFLHMSLQAGEVPVGVENAGGKRQGGNQGKGVTGVEVGKRDWMAGAVGDS